MENTNTVINNGAEKKKVLTGKNKKLIFFCLMAAPLILQVCVFYIYVNISNISLAFSKYEMVPGKGFISSFSGFENFAYVLETLFKPDNVGMFSVSLIMYAATLLIAMPVAIIFSFYVYKKYFLSEFFRIVLFFPQIISAVIMTSLYRYMVVDVYILLTGAESGLLSPVRDAATLVTTMIVYNLWMGFGANILLASGAMSGINESIVESCHLDGCSVMKEFFYITLPSIYPTIVTFVVIDLSTILSNQMNLYTLFKQNAPEGMRSIGYYLYVQTVHSSGLTAENGLYMAYPQISAMGVLITMVVLPLTLTVRKVMTKLGPSDH